MLFVVCGVVGFAGVVACALLVVGIVVGVVGDAGVCCCLVLCVVCGCFLRVRGCYSRSFLFVFD